MFGGRKGIVSSDCWALDCSTKHWRQLNIQVQPSISSAYGCDYNGKLYIFGGMVKESDRFCATNRFLEYNHEDESIRVLEPKNNGFTPPPLISASLTYHSRSLYLFGGMDHNANVSNRLYKYDFISHTWSIVNAPNPPAGRFGHSVNIWVKKGFYGGSSNEKYLVIYGGCLGKEMNMQNSGDLILYSIERMEWVYPTWGNTPEIGRAKHSAFFQGSKLIVFGGVYSKKRVVSEFSDLIPADTVLHIKFGTDYCRLDKVTSSKVVPRAAHSLAVKQRINQGIIFGGYTNCEGYAPDLSEILVVDFGDPPPIQVRLDNNCIKWDDPYNIHGQHDYELNIVEKDTNITRVVYKGKDNFWPISDLRNLKEYTAYVLIVNSFGHSPLNKTPLFQFTYHVLPPQNLGARLESANILLDWKSSQADRSYVLCYRIFSAAKMESSQKENTPWMETHVGTVCNVEKPVTFFIGEVSSGDIASEIEFHVKAINNTERSIASDKVRLNLKDYWENMIPSRPQASPVVMEEVMNEGDTNPAISRRQASPVVMEEVMNEGDTNPAISRPQASPVVMEEVMNEGDTNPAITTEEAVLEELEVGEAIRPTLTAVKDKSQKVPLEKKSSKIKIKRDFGVYQKDLASDKTQKELNIDKTQLPGRKEEAIDQFQISVKNKDRLHGAISESVSAQKRKYDQTISESPPGEVLNPKLMGDALHVKQIIPRKQFVKSEISAADEAEKSSEPIKRKSDNNVMSQKPPSALNMKNDLRIKDEIDKTLPVKKIVKSGTKSVEGNADKSLVIKSDSIVKSQNPHMSASPTALKVSAIRDDFIIGSLPVSQRLQLKMIEQQHESGQLRSPNDSNRIIGQNNKVAPILDYSTQKSSDQNDACSADKHVKETEMDHDTAGALKDPSVDSVEDLHAMLMDPSKPMYYNLKYGSEIQVLYIDDWWTAKAMFYAYDKDFNLYLKVHFPGWRSDEDRYVPLVDGPRVIRDTSTPVPDAKHRPTYKETKFRFDISSKTQAGHHGIHSSEKEQVLKNGYLLRPKEDNSLLLDDD